MREYTGPTAAAIASALPGSRREGNGGWRLRGFCHGSGGKRDSASLAVFDRPEGGLRVHCFVGCDRRTIITSLEQETGLTIWDAWENPGQAQRGFSAPEGILSAPNRAEKGQNQGPAHAMDMLAIALNTLDKTETIPTDYNHPARRWLANRNLWRPVFPLPGAVRWLPAAAHYRGRGPHTGAGSLVVLAAPPEAWTEAWPKLPEPRCADRRHRSGRLSCPGPASRGLGSGQT